MYPCIILNRDAKDETVISEEAGIYVNKNTIYLSEYNAGKIGVSKNNGPYYTNTSDTTYKIWHEGNLPILSLYIPSGAAICIRILLLVIEFNIDISSINPFSKFNNNINLCEYYINGYNQNTQYAKNIINIIKNISSSYILYDANQYKDIDIKIFLYTSSDRTVLEEGCVIYNLEYYGDGNYLKFGSYYNGNYSQIILSEGGTYPNYYLNIK